MYDVQNVNMYFEVYVIKHVCGLILTRNRYKGILSFDRFEVPAIFSNEKQAQKTLKSVSKTFGGRVGHGGRNGQCWYSRCINGWVCQEHGIFNKEDLFVSKMVLTEHDS